MIAHQSRRETILSIGITAAVALIVIGIEQSSPYTLLLVPLILWAVHMQITDIHAGIQRIATYLRIAHEGDGSELRWETASYLIRNPKFEEENNEKKKKSRKRVFFTPVFSSMEYLLGFIGLASIGIAIFIARTQPDLALLISLIFGGVSILMLGLYWKRSNARMKELETEEERQVRQILGLVKKKEDNANAEKPEGQ